MIDSVAVSAAEAASTPRVRLVPCPAVEPSTLSYQAYLGMGVLIDVDMLAPHHPSALSFPAGDVACDPLLRVLVGGRAAEPVRGGPAVRRVAADGGLIVDSAEAGPWLRVALVDALDRWLHLPLEQSLVDAERAVTRHRAARTLPDGPARAEIVDGAVRLARRAARDLVGVLRRLAEGYPPLQGAALHAVEQLVDGYRELLDEVHGPDAELLAVLDGWRRRRRAAEWTQRRKPPCRPAVPPPNRANDSARRLLDPRQVPARVLGLSQDPATPEVLLALMDGSVLVRVPTFRPVVDPDVLPRLMVRLVDRASADLAAHASLTLANGPSGGFLEATVARCGVDFADVRADVFDVLGELPAARTDPDRALRHARCATVFLAEWRRLMALARVPFAAVQPARLLRDMGGRLEPDAGLHDELLFPGGPSPADLDRLAAPGDDKLLDRMRADAGRARPGLLALTRGSAELLVAELVAAHMSCLLERCER